MSVQEQVSIKNSAFFDMPDKTHFSEKYRKGLRGVAIYSVAETKKLQPQMTLVEALAEILKTTNPDMPQAFVAEFVQHIIAAWERYELQKTTRVEKILVAEPQ